MLWIYLCWERPERIRISQSGFSKCGVRYIDLLCGIIGLQNTRGYTDARTSRTRNVLSSILVDFFFVVFLLIGVASTSGWFMGEVDKERNRLLLFPESFRFE